MMEFVVWNTVQKIMHLKFLDVGGTFLSKILITTLWQNEHQILGLNKKGILAPINVKKEPCQGDNLWNKDRCGREADLSFHKKNARNIFKDL